MHETINEGKRDLRRDAGSEASRTRRRPVPERKSGRGNRTARILAAAAAALILLWLVASILFEGFALATLAPDVNDDVGTANTLTKLFGALVLFLLSADRSRWGLRWISVGFLILAFGHLMNKFLEPLLVGSASLDVQLYERLLIWISVGTLFAVGLLPGTAPRFSWRRMLAVFVLFGALMCAAIYWSDLLPPLIEISDLEAAAVSSGSWLTGLTGWYWALSTLSLATGIAAVVGAVRHDRNGTVAGWLLVATVLLAGAQLHNIFWPSTDSPVLTTTQVLHLALAAAVAVGGLLELRRVAAERSALLATEQERTNRLKELAVLKADFTAMVAHELGNPLAAIQGYADMLSGGKLPPERRERTLEAIRAEIEALNALVADVQAAASVERDDFEVRPRPVALRTLLADAEAYADALPGDHPLVTRVEVHEQVSADAERVGQVLRNLLGNAAKYSPEGAPIEVVATLRGNGGRVRIEVADHGPGIHPDDADRIFEKFGRGREGNGRKHTGAGLGLYLSRRIMRAHGLELTVESRPGEGSVFAFELDLARR